MNPTCQQAKQAGPAATPKQLAPSLQAGLAQVFAFIYKPVVLSQIPTMVDANDTSLSYVQATMQRSCPSNALSGEVAK